MPHHPGRHTMTTTAARSSRTRSTRRVRFVAAASAIVAVLLVPAVASAHPLGNFTINHYAGLRIEPDRVLLDVVVDQAEIPTFQARLDFDTDGDGEVSDDEADAGRVVACETLEPSLRLGLDGSALDLRLVEAGLTFPPGVGGLSTMRLVCGFQAVPGSALAAGAAVSFTDVSFPDRLGWREIVVTGSGVTVAAAGNGELRAASTSARLTAYPTNLLTQGLHDASAAVVVTPGGPTLPPLSIDDATPVAGGGDISAGTAGVPPSPDATVTEPPSAPVANVVPNGSVPGGVGAADLPAIFRAADLSPVVLLVSLLTAAALGAGHALTPGHGKTLMAAYLVGTRGTPLHAAGLGLSVTVSHTLGILVLAALIVGAEGVLSPDLVVRAAPVVAALSILGIGGWMLAGEVRRRRRAAIADRAHRAAHEHGEEHDHAHEHDHDHAHEHEHDHDAPAGMHSHGGVAHSHVPPAGTTITWRGLFALGLAGGLIPSTSALLILLGSIAAGRPAFGFVLVVAFGLGMAVVMGGIGLALVLARGRLDRFDAGSPLGRVRGYVPLAAACLVLALGLYLTVQAIGGPAAL
jgi:nickel/cobalt exporter